MYKCMLYNFYKIKLKKKHFWFLVKKYPNWKKKDRSNRSSDEGDIVDLKSTLFFRKFYDDRTITMCASQKRKEIQGKEVPMKRGKEWLVQDQIFSLSWAWALCFKLSTEEGKQEGACSCSRWSIGFAVQAWFYSHFMHGQQCNGMHVAFRQWCLVPYDGE